MNRMDCGHHYEALVWDEDAKKQVCSACQAEAAGQSALARALQEAGAYAPMPGPPVNTTSRRPPEILEVTPKAFVMPKPFSDAFLGRQVEQEASLVERIQSVLPEGYKVSSCRFAEDGNGHKVLHMSLYIPLQVTRLDLEES